MCELWLDVDELKVEEANTLKFQGLHWYTDGSLVEETSRVHCTVYRFERWPNICCDCPPMLSSSCLLCTVSVHSCCPSAVYRALCPLVLSVSCQPCAVSLYLCCPSAVYHALCLFTYAVHQLSTMHCVCSLMLSFSSPPCTVSCCGICSLIHHL
jgi:hypothetical protein